MLIAVPTGVKIFNWLATLWGGRLRFQAPMNFALGFVAMFTMGGLSGIMHSSPPVDLQQTDSYFVVAHLHYVLFGGSVFGLLAGLYYWWPKVFGRRLDEGLGRLHFWLTLVGFNVTFFPQHYLGLVGMARRVYTYAPDLGWSLWNLVSTIGAFVLAVSFLVFITNVIRTQRRAPEMPSDPWDARTLEWSVPSPPPAHNFDRIPHVSGRDELWRRKHASGRAGFLGPRATDRVHMPSPSHWPILLAASLLVMLGGALIGLAPVIVGGIASLYCIARFMLEYHHRPSGYELTVPVERP
jgi:cytochrome c oxidase subunit 1